MNFIQMNFALLLCLFSLLPQGGNAAPQDPIILGNFTNPPIQFRPKPLWFWNNTTVTEAGILDQMQKCRDNSGYGGFGILPFGSSFLPKYLSDNYFNLYGVAVRKAQELGMKLCIYDEYGFPSGSAGAINGDGVPRFMNRYPDATVKRLDKIEETVTGPKAWSKKLPAGTLMSIVAMDTLSKERVDLTAQAAGGSISWNVPQGVWRLMVFVCVKDGDPNVDYLDPDAVDKFIGMVHQGYYDRFKEEFGTTIEGVFYDEPTMYRASGRTWTGSFNQKFQAKYGFSPTAYYPALWYNIGPDTQAARNYLFGFRAELYATGFMKRIQDWCDTHGDIYATGHQDNEDTKNPVGISGDLMKSNQFQRIPGIDKIGGGASRPAEKYYKLVSSAAQNWDKPLVMSETYGDMGNISWNEIYSIAMEQYTKGINMLIPHAVWYNAGNVSFLPELSYRSSLYGKQLPEYNAFMGRLNVMLQNDGRHVSDIAMLYPITSLQSSHYMDGPLGFYAGGVTTPEDSYADVGEVLSTEIGRDFTWLHPETLDERCSAEGDRLKLNNPVNFEDYRVVVLPAHQTIRWSNLQKIKQFYDNGGKVLAIGNLPSKSAEFGHDQEVVKTIREMFPNANPAPSVTASSQWAAGGYDPGKAFDGSMSTRWNAADQSGGNQWLEIDFGSERTFNKTRISEAFDRVSSYDIQYWNGSAWENCAFGPKIGSSRTDSFATVTSSKLRLFIRSITEASASIYEFEVYLNQGPNLLSENTLSSNRNKSGGKALFLQYPRVEQMKAALDSLEDVYDVEMEDGKHLRYIHKVKDGTDIYYLANTTSVAVDGYVRLRGQMDLRLLDPHTGSMTTPEYSLQEENGQRVTRVKVTLSAFKSCFLVSHTDSSFTGINIPEVIKNDLKIFPNPMKEQVTVRFCSEKFKELNLLNMAGKKLRSWLVPSQSTEMQIDVSQLEKGVYYVYMQGDRDKIGQLLVK